MGLLLFSTITMLVCLTIRCAQLLESTLRRNCKPKAQAQGKSPIVRTSKISNQIGKMYQDKVHEFQNLAGKLKLLTRNSEIVRQEIYQTLYIQDGSKPEFQAARNKLDLILEVTDRQHMKVAVCGRTSSGKSSLINALIGASVLPHGSGHTTIFPVEIHASEISRPHIVLSNEEEQQHSIEMRPGVLQEILQSMQGNQENLQKCCLKILWPLNRSQILRSCNAVLVDCPGLDITEVDFQPVAPLVAERHLDADLFTWVMNGESTLSNTEKDFFRRITQRLAKPNIIVAINRWDCTAEQEEYFIQAVQTQHQNRVATFLHNDLKIGGSLDDVKKQIFFVSAKEVFENQLHGSSEHPITEATLLNWSRFIKHLKEKLQPSIFGERLIPLLDASIVITQNVSEANHSLLKLCNSQCEIIHGEMASLGEKLDQLEQGISQITETLKQYVQLRLASLREVVSMAYDQEVEEISGVVLNFKSVFSSDKVLGDAYIDHLTSEIEEEFLLKLSMRLKEPLHQLISEAQLHILHEMSALLPEAKRHFAANIHPSRIKIDFSKAISLETDPSQLMTPTFQFSLRPSMLWQKYLGLRNSLFSVSSDETIGRYRIPNVLKEILHFAFGSDSSPGGFVIFGTISYFCNWRALSIFGACYATYYCYQRLHWSLFEREKDFKDRFLIQAQDELRERQSGRFVQFIQSQCQQELLSTMALACKAAETYGHEVKSELEETYTKYGNLTESMVKLNDCISSTNDVAMNLGAMKRTLNSKC